MNNTGNLLPETLDKTQTTNMKRTYLINKYNTKQLSRVIDCIAEHVNPEKIFLLGATVDHTQSENIFRGNMQPVSVVREYQLLILPATDNSMNIGEWQDLIESACIQYTPVTAMVVHLPVFNKWLQKGHLFAHTIYANNCLVYDAGNVSLAEPGIHDLPRLHSKLTQECKEWLHRANELMAGVEFYKRRSQFSLATFLLHQAAELTLMAAIRQKTGFKASTHDLDKLLRYAIPFCGDDFNVFPQVSNNDKMLFRLLQRSYIQSRYNNGFTVKEQDFLVLQERVDKLLEGVQELNVLESRL